jgi:CheY-like chemotaxis protein
MATILVVDDSAVDRAIVRGVLEKEPHWKIEHAEDGREALKKIEKSPPDAVVTDLQMPGMDGLELVTAVRDFHPEVPVVLMTAHGSETLALDALKRGAASYVPKSQLIETLAATVKQVLSLARAEHRHMRLIGCLAETEFTFCLENDFALIDALVDFVQGIIGGIKLCDAAGRLRLGMALQQALLNALYWGNLAVTLDDIEEFREQLLMGNAIDLVEQRRNQEPYRDRKIFVHARITPEEARFVVRDEGRGFDVTTLPGFNVPANLASEGGRGLVLMRAFMDEVAYNDVGNEVVMVKRRECGTSHAELASRQCLLEE